MAKLIDGTRIYGNTTIDSNLVINGGYAATSTTTGSLQLLGGAGITGNLYVGGNVGIGTSSPSTLLTVNGTATITTLNLTNALTLNGSVSGQITISPPSAAGTNTLTLPAATGTVALTANPTFTGTVTATTITSPAATNLTIQSGGTTAMTIDTSQNVGIGTSSPSSKLSVGGNPPSSGAIAGVASSGGTSLALSDNANNSLYVRHLSGAATFCTDTGGQLAFATNGNTERMRIDASGNMGLGTTSPVNLGAGRTGLTLNGSTDSVLWMFANGGTSGFLQGTTSLINFVGATNIPVAISAQGTGYIQFITGGSERMRIDASGNLLVGYQSSNGSYKLQVNSQIFATSSTIATSDANYKTNVMPLSGALDIVQKLNPVSFSWKEHAVHNFDTATPTVGFLAQEVQTALSSQTYVNSIVKESEVTLPDETKEKFLGIAEGNMIALLTKAIQELKATVDAQAAEITALKVKVGV
jgi:hypothetical protein